MPVIHPRPYSAGSVLQNGEPWGGAPLGRWKGSFRAFPQVERGLWAAVLSKSGSRTSSSCYRAEWKAAPWRAGGPGRLPATAVTRAVRPQATGAASARPPARERDKCSDHAVRHLFTGKA
ncbi:hypothetical protein GCM10010246_51720 [Streptomyces cuspidosporus]|uniref:Uncharacterized protein n=1 Tax=Streptomyces cuspidosporus TaxID=66882 RepID=A0ABN3GMW0_9ACTN